MKPVTAFKNLENHKEALKVSLLQIEKNKKIIRAVLKKYPDAKIHNPRHGLWFYHPDIKADSFSILPQGSPSWQRQSIFLNKKIGNHQVVFNKIKPFLLKNSQNGKNQFTSEVSLLIDYIYFSTRAYEPFHDAIEKQIIETFLSKVPSFMLTNNYKWQLSKYMQGIEDSLILQ